VAKNYTILFKKMVKFVQKNQFFKITLR